MKVGISSLTFPWAIGFPDATPDHPLKPIHLLEKAQELGVGLVQYGPNMPLERMSESQLREVVKHANAWDIDLEMSTVGIAPETMRERIEFARRMDVILLRTTPEYPLGTVPMRTEISNCLRAIVEDLTRGEIGLAIDNSRIPAPELNEMLEQIRSPWLGAALDTATPMALLQGWQTSIRVLGHRTLCLHIKDFVVQPAAHGMGFSVKGCPVGKGQLNIPWLVESFAALRIEPSAILESWTPEQATLKETIGLEAEWAKQGIAYLRRFVPD
jgi:sugar phosphate isomerase/epimerase